MQEEEEYSIFEKIYKESETTHKEEEKQIDLSSNLPNGEGMTFDQMIDDEFFDVERLIRQLESNRMTMTVDELRRQEEILMEIMQAQQRRKEQLR